MKTRPEAVAAARAWLNTPYIKGARIRGAGCDCETLIEAYLIEIGAATGFDLPVYSQDWFCNTEEECYRNELSKVATCVWEGRCLGTPPAQPGDIAIFRVAGSRVYNHGAIVTEWPRSIHAFDVGVRELRPALHPLTSHREMAVFDPWKELGGKMIDRIPAEWLPMDEQCLELSWGDWTIEYMYDPAGYYLLVPSGVQYGPFSTLEAVKQHAEDVRGD